MTRNEILQRAKELSIKGTSKMKKGELIRAIQLAEANNGCYGADWRYDCVEGNCCWRDDCQTEQSG